MTIYSWFTYEDSDIRSSCPPRSTDTASLQTLTLKDLTQVAEEQASARLEAGSSWFFQIPGET